MTQERASIGPKALELAFLVVAAVFGVVTAYLVFGLEFDHWDGVIFDYAASTGDFSGVHEMNRQVGGLAQGALFELIDMATAAIGPAFWHSFRFLSLGLFAAGVFLVICALGAADASQAPAVLAAALVPLAGLATSSMNAAVYLFLGLGLIGAAQFQSRSAAAQVVGTLLVFCGMAVLHAAPALIGLAALVFVVSRWRRLGERHPRRATLLQALGLVSVLLSMFLANRVISPPTGLYETYGDLSVSSFSGLALAVTEQFLRLAAPLVLVLLFLGPAVGIVLRRQDRTVPWMGPTGMTVLGLLIIIGLNAIPFAATGRSVPFLPDIGNRGAGLEDYRYALFAIALAQVTFALVVQSLLRGHRDPDPSIWLVGLPVMVSAPLFFWVWGQMVALDDAKSRIVADWGEAAARTEWTSSAACSVPMGDAATRVYSELGYYFRFYDLNYLGFKANGAANHFVCWDQCSPAQQLELAEWLCQSAHPELTYVFSGTTCARVVSQLHGHVERGEQLPDCF